MVDLNNILSLIEEMNGVDAFSFGNAESISATKAVKNITAGPSIDQIITFKA